MANASQSTGVAVIILDNAPVNAMSAAVRAQALAALHAAEADRDIRAIVITGAGKVFSGGADITEFGKTPVSPSLPDLINAIEACSKPVVAAINGVAFGGGTELPLGCHGRVGSTAASMALPEIKLGLIPGAGGTQRLPRLIDPVAAFEFMLSGDPVKADRALALGLLDAAVEPEDLLVAASARALALADSGELPRLRNHQPNADRADAFTAAAQAAVKKAGQLANTQGLIDTVQAAFDLPFDDGLALERARFVTLMAGDQSKALRYVFFSERETAKVPGITKDTPVRDIRTAAVIGAGTMGGGIAMCFVNAGIPVTLIEMSEDALANGIKRIAGNYDASVKRGSLTEDVRNRRMSLIDGRVGLAAAEKADIVVEAVFEEMGVKTALFADLDRIVKPGAILATNTSYLDVDGIAAATRRPHDVLGLHFFSPANVMRLLEIVRTRDTAPDVLATALKLGKTLGKLSVVSGVCFGFIGNRILQSRAAAAERVLLHGALPFEVDDAITGFGFRMGHFAMGDLAGLDIGWRIRKAFGGKAPVADALADQGRFGQKTGRGFYLYPEGARTGERDPQVEQLVRDFSQKAGVARRSYSPAELVERLLYPMVNEGARILEEGIAARAGDIDMVWINGYGWPAWRGGPMYWADQVGLDHIVASLDAQAAESGEARLKPCALLRRLAAEGRGFGSVPAAQAAPVSEGVA